ncbi:MAG: amidohydrolase [Roseivirga sp.]
MHRNPELSGQEKFTASHIHEFLAKYNPDEVITNLGDTGVAAIWNSKKAGKTVLIRAELDALPIHESNTFLHRSNTPNTSHKCGHDGHMSILCGLAVLLQNETLTSGRVVLLFQPAEETGQGAKAVIEDDRFKKIKPDYAFALHNLPKHAMGTVFCKKGSFCAASTGLKVTYHGTTAHASQPKSGNNPAVATAQLIHCLDRILETNDFTNRTLITLTHCQVGEKSFGVSAGKSETWLTLRAFEKHDFDLLLTVLKEEATAIGKRYGLEVELSLHESFEVTENHHEAVELIKKAAETIEVPFTEMTAPNPWSEDFGLILKEGTGAMFGLGSGHETPDLHNPDYDFPDQLIETGVKMFWQLIKDSIPNKTEAT